MCDVVRKNPGARGNEQQQDRRKHYITLCLPPDHRIHSSPFGSVTAGEKLLELRKTSGQIRARPPRRRNQRHPSPQIFVETDMNIQSDQEGHACGSSFSRNRLFPCNTLASERPTHDQRDPPAHSFSLSLPLSLSLSPSAP